MNEACTHQWCTYFWTNITSLSLSISLHYGSVACVSFTASCCGNAHRLWCYWRLSTRHSDWLADSLMVFTYFGTNLGHLITTTVSIKRKHRLTRKKMSQKRERQYMRRLIGPQRGYSGIISSQCCRSTLQLPHIKASVHIMTWISPSHKRTGLKRAS